MLKNFCLKFKLKISKNLKYLLLIRMTIIINYKTQKKTLKIFYKII